MYHNIKQRKVTEESIDVRVYVYIIKKKCVNPRDETWKDLVTHLVKEKKKKKVDRKPNQIR